MSVSSPVGDEYARGWVDGAQAAMTVYFTNRKGETDDVPAAEEQD